MRRYHILLLPYSIPFHKEYKSRARRILQVNQLTASMPYNLLLRALTEEFKRRPEGPSEFSPINSITGKSVELVSNF